MDNVPQKLFFNTFHIAGIHTGVPHSPGRRLRMSISSNFVVVFRLSKLTGYFILFLSYIEFLVNDSRAFGV